MSNKTVIVILVIAAALTGFIFLFERDTLSTSEKQERKNRVFTEYKRDRVDRLTLKHISGAEIELEKKASAKDPEGLWSVVKPKALDADQTEVESLLSSLDFLLVDRALPADKNLKDSRFGFDAPRIRGSFTLLGKKTDFQIGQDAEGEKVYFHTDAAKDKIFAVNQDILTSLDKSLSDLRSKNLISSSLGDATQIHIKRAVGEVDLKQTVDGWQLVLGDKHVLASEDQVGELRETVGDLKAERFIADDVQADALDGYGLGAAASEVTVTRKDNTKVSVKLGAPCKDAPTLRYAFTEPSSTVTCVKEDLQNLLDRPLLRFQETRLSPLAAEEVKRIALARGAKSLVFEHGEATWKMKGSAADVDSDAVSALLFALTEPKAKQIDTDAAVLSALKAPVGTVTLSTADDKKTVLEIFDVEGDMLKIKRQGEAALLRVPSELDQTFTVDPLSYRDKTIRVGDVENIDRIEISGTTAQSLEKKDGIWQMTAPIARAADMTAARSIADHTARIQAEKFVAESADKTHGFDKPFAVIKTHFTASDNRDTDDGTFKPAGKETTSILEIGGAAPNGSRYARLRGKDESVFLLGEEYVQTVKSPMIARDLLQIDDTALKRLTFKTKDAEAVFTKTGDDTWKSEGGTSFKVEDLKKIVADLGAVKAIGAKSFGPTPETAASPTLVITAQTDENDKAGKSLTFGPKSEDPDENAYLARIDGLDVTYLYPARLVDDVLQFMGAAAAQP